MSDADSSSNSGPQPRASVILPTRNRRDWLRKAIASSFNQTVAVEVLVFDDASSDDTEAMVRKEFPQVRYFRNDVPMGPCVSRNRGTELARSPIVFPIDDDAEFQSRNTIEQTLADFEDPRIGAVAIPFINVQQSPAVLCQPPDRDGFYVTFEFVGASHAMRRDIFLRVGGYRTEFFYMGEEPDFCMRMLNAGYVTRLGRADVIHHHESPSRIRQRAWELTCRNKLLSAWYTVPMPALPVHLAGVTVNLSRFGLARGHPIWTLRGVFKGWGGILARLGKRQPVGMNIYRTARRLIRAQCLPFDSIAAELPGAG